MNEANLRYFFLFMIQIMKQTHTDFCKRKMDKIPLEHFQSVFNLNYGSLRIWYWTVATTHKKLKCDTGMAAKEFYINDYLR